MPQTFDDIDCLIERLKSVAEQLHDEPPSAEPPPFAYRQRLGALLADEPSEVKVGDPKHPRLEELLAPEEDDEAFLQRVYRLLMGRAPDPEGRHRYLTVLPRAGRLYVLAVLLCADETREYLSRHGVVVAHHQSLTLPLRLLDRLGPAGRLLRPPVRLVYRAASIALRPRMRTLARRGEAERHVQRRERLIRDLLLDMDAELQRQENSAVRRDERIESLESLEAQCETLSRHQPALWSALQQHRRAVERLVQAPADACLPREETTLPQDMVDAYYLAFEEACRGSEDSVLTHLQQYQPQWQQALAVGHRALDLGCGRGEWLALLARQGFEAQGVDLNISMIDHCRQAGLNVEHADILTALRSRPDDSHALVSAFHIAEHLPFDALYALVDEARRILVPGGVLIIETPNPENLLVGSHTFYHDPTHRNPLTPTALTFLLTYHGLAEVEVRRFNPYPESAKVPGNDPLTERVNGHLCGPQDFAVVGVKVAAATQAPQGEQA